MAQNVSASPAHPRTPPHRRGAPPNTQCRTRPATSCAAWIRRRAGGRRTRPRSAPRSRPCGGRCTPRWSRTVGAARAPRLKTAGACLGWRPDCWRTARDASASADAPLCVRARRHRQRERARDAQRDARLCAGGHRHRRVRAAARGGRWCCACGALSPAHARGACCRAQAAAR